MGAKSTWTYARAMALTSGTPMPTVRLRTYTRHGYLATETRLTADSLLTACFEAVTEGHARGLDFLVVEVSGPPRLFWVGRQTDPTLTETDLLQLLTIRLA
jgi:hypothetical protein